MGNYLSEHIRFSDTYCGLASLVRMIPDVMHINRKKVGLGLSAGGGRIRVVRILVLVFILAGSHGVVDGATHIHCNHVSAWARR